MGTLEPSALISGPFHAGAFLSHQGYLQPHFQSPKRKPKKPKPKKVISLNLETPVGDVEYREK